MINCKILLLLLPLFQQGLSDSPPVYTLNSLLVTPGNIYPGKGSSCQENGTLPLSWIQNDGQCCRCYIDEVECANKTLLECPDTPDDTTNCVSSQVCGCNWWICDGENPSLYDYTTEDDNDYSGDNDDDNDDDDDDGDDEDDGSADSDNEGITGAANLKIAGQYYYYDNDDEYGDVFLRKLKKRSPSKLQGIKRQNLVKRDTSENGTNAVTSTGNVANGKPSKHQNNHHVNKASGRGGGKGSHNGRAGGRNSNGKGENGHTKIHTKDGNNTRPHRNNNNNNNGNANRRNGHARHRNNGLGHAPAGKKQGYRKGGKGVSNKNNKHRQQQSRGHNKSGKKGNRNGGNTKKKIGTGNPSNGNNGGQDYTGNLFGAYYESSSGDFTNNYDYYTYPSNYYNYNYDQMSPMGDQEYGSNIGFGMGGGYYPVCNCNCGGYDHSNEETDNDNDDNFNPTGSTPIISTGTGTNTGGSTITGTGTTPSTTTAITG